MPIQLFYFLSIILVIRKTLANAKLTSRDINLSRRDANLHPLSRTKPSRARADRRTRFSRQTRISLLTLSRGHIKKFATIPRNADRRGALPDSSGGDNWFLKFFLPRAACGVLKHVTIVSEESYVITRAAGAREALKLNRLSMLPLIQLPEPRTSETGKIIHGEIIGSRARDAIN